MLNIHSDLTAGVMAQTDEPIKKETAAAVGSSIVRGDMVQKPSQFPGKKHYTLHNNNTFY